MAKKTHNQVINIGSIDPPPDKVLTYKDNADWFDSHAVYHDNPAYDKMIRQRVYSGKYGYNPNTGVLTSLDKNKHAKIPEEVKKIRKEEDRIAAMSPYERQLENRKKWEKEVRDFNRGRIRVAIEESDAWRPNSFKFETPKGTRDINDYIGKSVYMTPKEAEAYNKAMLGANKQAVFQHPLTYLPGMIAGATIFPAYGAIAGGMQTGVDVAQGNWDSVALDAALTAVPGFSLLKASKEAKKAGKQPGTIFNPSENTPLFKNFEEAGDYYRGPFREILEEKKKWLGSDEYIKRRQANTGEKVKDIKADVDKQIKYLDQLSIDVEDLLDQGVEGYATFKGGSPKVSLDESNYFNSPEITTGTFKHETDHIGSPFLGPGSQSAIMRKAEKTYPRLEIEKPSLTTSQKITKGLDPEGALFAKNASWRKDLDVYDYYNKTIEQQVRQNMFNELIRKDLGLGKIYGDTPTLSPKNIEDWMSKFKDGKELSFYLDDIGYSDIKNLLGLHQKKLKGSVFGESQKEFINNLTNTLNKAWSTVPAGLAVGVAASQTEFAQGGYINNPSSLLKLGINENRIIQDALTSQGFDTKGVDGYIGQNTTNAVKEFQKAKGLKVDGIIGKNTINALFGDSVPTRPTPAPGPARTLEPLVVKGQREAAPATTPRESYGMLNSLQGQLFEGLSNYSPSKTNRSKKEEPYTKAKRESPFKKAEDEVIVLNRQKSDNASYGRFMSKGNTIINRTGKGRQRDSNKLVEDIVVDINNNQNRNKNTLIIDIGSGLGNDNPQEAGISVAEMSDYIYNNADVVATDIPDSYSNFEKHKKAGNTYKFDSYKLPLSYNTPVGDILKTKTKANKKEYGNIILRAANGIDLLMNEEETKDHLRHIAKELDSKKVYYVFNKDILYKAPYSKKFEVVGEVNNAGFDHRTDSWNYNLDRIPYSTTKEKFAQGGDLNDSPYKQQAGPVANQEESDRTGMMKARMAYENQFGNPAGERMVSPNPLTYDFGNGSFGTHYMSSIDNYVVPLLQEENGQLNLKDYGPESNEAMRFENPEDADYFAKNYKNIAPMMKYANGGLMEAGDPPAKNLKEVKVTGKGPIKVWKGHPRYDEYLNYKASVKHWEDANAAYNKFLKDNPNARIIKGVPQGASTSTKVKQFDPQGQTAMFPGQALENFEDILKYTNVATYHNPQKGAYIGMTPRPSSMQWEEIEEPIKTELSRRKEEYLKTADPDIVGYRKRKIPVAKDLTSEQAKEYFFDDSNLGFNSYEYIPVKDASNVTTNDKGIFLTPEAYYNKRLAPLETDFDVDLITGEVRPKKVIERAYGGNMYPDGGSLNPLDLTKQSNYGYMTDNFGGAPVEPQRGRAYFPSNVNTPAEGFDYYRGKAMDEIRQSQVDTYDSNQNLNEFASGEYHPMLSKNPYEGPYAKVAPEIRSLGRTQFGFGADLAKGIGAGMQALAPLAAMIPGPGTAIAAGAGAIGGALSNVGEGNPAGEVIKDSIMGGAQGAMGALSMGQSLGSIPGIKAFGGEMNNVTQYNGLTHEEGGLPLGNTNNEVEDGEVRWDGPNGEKYIFSNRINYKK